MPTRTAGSSLMAMLSKAFLVAISIGSFIYTLNVLFLLICFTSDHNESYKSIVHPDTEESHILSTLWHLLIDACLLSTFMLQHSFMATDIIKSVFHKLHLDEIERCIYNAASAMALNFLINNWHPVPAVSLWDIDTSTSNKLWLVFVAFHILGWSVIFSGCIMMDVSELIGMKQVWYKISSRPYPLTTKSRELQRYFAHMRHPSFTGFSMILWIHPLMTLDRFLLSSLLTVYMIMMWTIDKEDYRYHASTFHTKRHHLS